MPDDTMISAQEAYRLQKETRALAARLNVTIHKGNRGGWLLITLPSGLQKKVQGWYALSRLLSAIAAR